MVLKNLEDPSVVQLTSPPANARLMAHVPGDTTDYYVEAGDLDSAPSGANDAVRRNVNSFSGATITDKLQAAVDSGEPLAMPPGTHTLDGPITIPSSGMDIVGAGDGLRRAGGTIIRSGQGDDIFKAVNSSSVQARTAGLNHITVDQLGFRLRPNGADTRGSYERCTATGYGIGQCAIVEERARTGGNWPTETTGTRSISDAWNHSHSRITNVTCDVEDGSAIDHGCGLYHSQGNTYGSRFRDLDSAGGQSGTRRGVHSLLTIAQPYEQKCTADAAGDRIVTTTTNQFLNDQQCVVRTHDATGSQPGGVDFDQVYFVVNRNSTGFQLSLTQGGGAVNITSAGAGLIYAILVGSAGAVFSPDEVYIDRISHYNGKMGVSVCNPERLYLGNLTSYAIETILEIPGLLSTSSRTQAVGVTIENIYSESPQATPGNANSPAILIDADGLEIGYLQVRGADTGSRPIYEFNGRAHTIHCLDGRSSASQLQPDIRFNATATTITGGQAHTSSLITAAADIAGRLSRSSGSGFFPFDANFV